MKLSGEANDYKMTKFGAINSILEVFFNYAITNRS